MSICIAIGHGKSSSGGYDPGAVFSTTHEFKVAKEIGKYAAAYYNENYAERCDLINYNGEYFLSERYKLANQNGYDFLAELHLNAGGGTGTEVYHSVYNTDKTAATISAAIASAFGIKNRGAKTKTTSSGSDYFGIIRETRMEAVLIETVFIDTPSDLALVSTAAGQKKMGEVIAKAIAKARGVKEKDKKAKPSAEAPKKTDENAIYRIQTGAFKDRQNADAYVQKLKEQGFPAIIVKDK